MPREWLRNCVREFLCNAISPEWKFWRDFRCCCCCAGEAPLLFASTKQILQTFAFVHFKGSPLLRTIWGNYENSHIAVATTWAREKKTQNQIERKKRKNQADETPELHIHTHRLPHSNTHTQQPAKHGGIRVRKCKRKTHQKMCKWILLFACNQRVQCSLLLCCFIFRFNFSRRPENPCIIKNYKFNWINRRCNYSI